MNNWSMNVGQLSISLTTTIQNVDELSDYTIDPEYIRKINLCSGENIVSYSVECDILFSFVSRHNGWNAIQTVYNKQEIILQSDVSYIFRVIVYVEKIQKSLYPLE